MYFHRFLYWLEILYVFSCARGARVTTGIGDFNKTETEVVNTNIVAPEDILQIVADVENLQKKTSLLEKQVKRLEHQDEEKNSIIHYLQTQISDIIKADTGNKNLKNVIGNGSDFIDDGGNGNENLRKKRQVTVPNIAFSAYRSQTQSLAPGQTVKYDKVLLNEGHAYNSYTGVFTAPVSGTYVFTFNIFSTIHTFVRLNLDGANMVDAVANPHVTSLSQKGSMGGQTAVFHVGIGQSVSVEVYDVSGEVGSTDQHRLSTFSGFLLYPEHT